MHERQRLPHASPGNPVIFNGAKLKHSCDCFQFHCRCDPANGHVGPVIVVRVFVRTNGAYALAPERFSGLILCLLYRFKDVLAGHSCRTVRLYRWIWAFCWGYPGWIYSMAMPRLQAHSTSTPLTFSGPLSTRIVSGLPRHSMIWFLLRTTRIAVLH